MEFQLVRALWKIHPLFLPLIFLGSYVVASSIHMRDKRVRERRRLRREEELAIKEKLDEILKRLERLERGES